MKMWYLHMFFKEDIKRDLTGLFTGYFKEDLFMI